MFADVRCVNARLPLIKAESRRVLQRQTKAKQLQGKQNNLYDYFGISSEGQLWKSLQKTIPLILNSQLLKIQERKIMMEAMNKA